MFMVSLQPVLSSLLKSLPPRPVEQEKLNELVKETLSLSRDKSSVENRKSQWEYLLKNEIFLLAATEGRALKNEGTSYYDELRDKLDLVLTFTEHDACEQTFPFVVLQDLLETQTISSCSHVFSWIEARAARLTEGMIPQKGKALILLRTLNDLLRRLSKIGSTTIFCGRILTFLSGVFPLGERSGVNLRGEYGPTWEGVKETEVEKRTDPDEKMEELKSEPEEDVKESKEADEGGENVQPDVKETKKSPTALKPSEKKSNFYSTFWSVQLYFSKPPLFAVPNTLVEFKDAVNKVLPAIKEATAKERAMMGSRAGVGAGLKRKRESDVEETNINEYFFAKFLTSPDLLDLEIADTHFRRQFLFQLLILLNHLLTFTKQARATWSSSRNRSLQMDFTLETTDAQWVQETLNKAMEELRQTTPNGRAFAETVGVILEREKNWVKWKNELCAPFDREPWAFEIDGAEVGLLEATKGVRERMRESPSDWKWKLGTEPLTEIWDMGCRGLDDLQNPFEPGDVKDFVKKVKQEDARIELRKKNIAPPSLAHAKATAKIAPVLPTLEKELTAPSDKVQELPVSSDTPTTTLLAPRPITGPPPTNLAGSPLHPSLPAKPGLTSPAKPLSSSSQEPVRNSTPVPTLAASTITPLPSALIPAPIPASAPTPAQVEPALPALPPPSTDEQILKFEENKQRWSWLALRTARDQHLQHFGKIGTGDIELLAQEIEKEKQDREKAQKTEDISGAVNVMGTADDAGIESPMTTITAGALPGAEDARVIKVSRKSDAEGDVKMEES